MYVAPRMTQTSFACSAEYSRYWGTPLTYAATVSAAAKEFGPYSIRLRVWSKAPAFPTPLIAKPNRCSALATSSATFGVPTPFKTSTSTSDGGSVTTDEGGVAEVVVVDVDVGGDVVVDTAGRVVEVAGWVLVTAGSVVVTFDDP